MTIIQAREKFEKFYVDYTSVNEPESHSVLTKEDVWMIYLSGYMDMVWSLPDEVIYKR